MKTVAISLGIGAILAGSFSKTFGAASKGVSNLSKEIINLKNSQKLLAQYDKDRKNLQLKIDTINKIKLAIKNLKISMKDEKNQTEANKKSLIELDKELQDLYKTYRKESETLHSNSKKLKDKKIALDDTAKSYKELEKEIRRAEKATILYNKSNSYKEKAGQISKIGNKALGVATIGAGLLYKPIQSAIKAEADFAAVKKQFDFKTKEEEEKFKKELHKIITEKKIAISLEELYGAAANAGQVGLNQNEAIPYIELASKIGMAFDMSREEAAKAMFNMRNSLNLTYEDLVKLTDRINYLGDTTGANAPAITDYMNRVGSIGKIAGFSDTQIAALGASLIDQGMEAEVAATGSRKLLVALNKGAAATKSQAEMFKKLGLDPIKLAKLAQEDAEKALFLVLSKIKNSENEEKISILTLLFGQEGLEASSKLINNLDQLKENIDKIRGNQADGSIDKEADIKRATVDNQLKILQGKLSILGSQFGTLLLPEVNKFVESISKAISKVIEFQQANPEGFKKLIKSFAAGIGVLFGFGAALKVISGGISMYSKYMEIAGFMTEHKFGTKLLSTGKKMFGTIGKMAKGIKAFGLTLLTNPLTWYIAGILAIVAAGYLLYKNWDTVKEKAVHLKNKVIELLDKFWFLLGPFGYLIKAGITLYKNWDTVKEKAVQLKEKIADMVVRAIENWETFKTATKESLGAVFSWIEKQWDGVKEKGQQVLDFFLNIFQKIKDGISGAFDTVKGWVTSEPKNTHISRTIPGYARGGIVTSPTLAWIGEGTSSESIIPHDSSERSFNLWEKTGRLIGAYEKINSSSNTSIEFSFSPVIYANDSEGVHEELKNAKRNAFEEFKKLMDRYNRENRRLGYGR